MNCQGFYFLWLYLISNIEFLWEIQDVTDEAGFVWEYI